MTRRYLLAAALVLGTVSMAEAGLEICNETDFLQSVAIGYKGDTDWTSEGWWNLEPQDCVTLVQGDLTKRYYYYYAESASETFESQDYVFCIQDDLFTIVGDTKCEDRGYQTTGFREIDTGETATEYTLTLVEPGQTSTPLPTTSSGKGPGGGAQSTSEVPPETTVSVAPGDLRSGLTPGRYGTAFETQALFQGCELEEGRAYCGFHADGVKMRAFHDGQTPDKVLLALEQMDVNTPVLLRGDRVDGTGLQATIVAREVIPRPGADDDARLRAAMQGDWVSTQDRRVRFTIRGSELYPRLSGEFRGARFLRIAKSCNGSKGRGPVLIQTKLADQRQFCFVIDTLGDGKMNLTDVSRGKQLSYVTVK